MTEENKKKQTIQSSKWKKRIKQMDCRYRSKGGTQVYSMRIHIVQYNKHVFGLMRMNFLLVHIPILKVALEQKYHITDYRPDLEQIHYIAEHSIAAAHLLIQLQVSSIQC